MIALEWKKEAVKALHLRETSAGLRVLDARSLAHVDLPAWLGSRRREEIRVAGNFQRCIHKTLHVPAVRSALHAIAAREAAELVGEDAEICFEDLGEEEVQGEPRLKLAAAAVARQELESLAEALGAAGVEPAFVTTAPLMVQLLLERLGCLSDEAVACLEIDEDRSTLLVVRGPEVRIARGLPHGSEAAAAGLKPIVDDIKQTFFFHGAKFRGETVRRLVVSGAFAAPSALETMARDLEIEVVPLDLSAVVAKTDAARARGYAACLGLALAGAVKSKVALEPPSLRALRGSRRHVRALACAVAASALLVVVPGALLSRQSQELRVLESTARREIAAHESWLRGMHDDLVAHEVTLGQPSWDEFVRELSAAVPEGTWLSSLSVTRTPAGWGGAAAGEVLSADPVLGLLLADDLRARLERSGLFDAPQVQPQVEDGRIRFDVKFQVALRRRLG